MKSGYRTIAIPAHFLLCNRGNGHPLDWYPSPLLSQEWWGFLELLSGSWSRMYSCLLSSVLLFSFTMASVHIILTCAVLCCHSNTWCLAAFLSHAQAGRGGEREIDGGVGVRRYRSHHQWQTAFILTAKVCLRRHVSVLHRASLVFSVRLSLRVHFPIPPASRWPHASISFRGPSSAGRGHVSSMTDCTICSGLGTNAHAHTYSHMQVGRQVKHAYTHNSMLPFWISLGLPKMFFPSVSSSFFSHGFHFWHFNVCDTDKQGWAHQEMWTWQRRNNWLRSNTVRTSQSVHLYLLLYLFLRPSLGLSVCLFVCLRLLCGYSYVVETVASAAKRNPRADWHKIPMVPSSRCFFQPAHIWLLWTNGFWLVVFDEWA